MGMAFAQAIATVFVFTFTATVIYSINYGLRWVEGNYGTLIFWAAVVVSVVTLAIAAVFLDMRQYRLSFRQMRQFYWREWYSPSDDDKPPQDRP